MNHRTVVIITDFYVIAARFQRRSGQWKLSRTARATTAILSEFDVESSVEPLAATIRGILTEVDAVSDSLDLLIPADWCFIRQLHLPHRRFDGESASYLMEEYLPLPLEEVTCAFQRGNDEKVWCIATPNGRLLELIGLLEGFGSVVEHIRIDIFAALAICKPEPCCVGLTIVDTQRVALAICARDRRLPRVVRVFRVAQTEDRLVELGRQIELTESVSGISPERWLHCDLLDEDAAARLEEFNDQMQDDHKTSTTTLGVTDLFVSCIQYPDQPDLRTGVLASANRGARAVRKATHCLLLLSILFLAMFININVYNKQCREKLDSIHNAQAELFAEVFPDATSTRNPALRCASERKRLEALTNAESGSSSNSQIRLVERHQPLIDLRELVAGLPKNVRVMLLELTVDSHQLTVRGQTTDHRDAERIGESVGRLASMECRPPRTSRLKQGGVEFSIRAQRKNDDRPEETVASVK